MTTSKSTIKVWGRTHTLLDTPLCSIHKLHILPGARCSLHFHKHKWNAFYVVRGHLILDIERVNGCMPVPHDLSAGDFYTVKPAALHQFRTPVDEGCICLEIYYVEPLSEDIIRRDVGERIDKDYTIGQRKPHGAKPNH